MNMRQLHSSKPKLDIGLFVEFCVFPCFYQFLHDVIIKFCFDLQKGNTQKSTNNPMSSFGLKEQNVELSHIHLAVLLLSKFGSEWGDFN